jgi:hypothetical protein
MYFKVPKCAGTTVDVLIKNTLKSKGVKYNYSPNTICKSKNLWVVKGYTEYKIGKIIETDFWNESEKFTIVRNPFDKVLSSWLFCLKNNFYRGDFHSFVKNEYIRYKENKKWINYTSWKEELKEFYRKEFNVDEEDLDSNLYDLLINGINNDKLDLNIRNKCREAMCVVHGQSIYSTLTNDRIDNESFLKISHIDRIFKMETDMNELRLYLEKILDTNLPILEKENSTNHKHYSHYYTKEIRDMVEITHEDDLKAFGYSYNKS